MQAKEYQQKDGKSPYKSWFDNLNTQAALKVRTAVARLEKGNFSNVEPAGTGVSECKISFGPGYRVYFAKDDDKIILLLGGGTKKRQQNDINNANFLFGFVFFAGFTPNGLNECFGCIGHK